MMRRLAIILVSILLASSVYGQTLTSFTVTDYSGVNRTNEPVTSGFPIKVTENILTTANLNVTDSGGTPIPAQFTVLSRWDGIPSDTSKPIKWVLVDFQANVNANATATYYLKNDGAGVTTTSLTYTEDANKITVETGTAKFEISKNHFNLFDNVWLEPGDTLVHSSAAAGGIVLIDDADVTYSSFNEAPEGGVTVDEGSATNCQRIVIKIRGVLKTAGGTYFAPSIYNYGDWPAYPYFRQPTYLNSFIYYNVRLYFYNGKDYCRVVFTLEQNGCHGQSTESYCGRQQVKFKSVYLNIPTTLASSIKTNDGTVTISGADTFNLFQGWTADNTDCSSNYTCGSGTEHCCSSLSPDWATGPVYTIKKNGATQYIGTTTDGWVDANNSSVGVGIAIRDFWQNWYKSIEATTTAINIGFWPTGGHYPFDPWTEAAGTYMFGPGRHKTHEFLIGWYAGAQGTYAQSLSRKIQQNSDYRGAILFALAPTDYYIQSEALGMFAPTSLTSSDPTRQEALTRYNDLMLSLIDPASSSNGWTMFTERNTAGHGYDRKWRFWGWMNYGDWLWKTEVYMNGHEAFPSTVLGYYIAGGDRKFFDLADQMIRHRYDIDQYHGNRQHQSNNHKRYNYCQRFEQERHSEPSYGDTFFDINHFAEGDEPSVPAYTWNKDVIWWYWLTGDRKAYDTIQEQLTLGTNSFGTYGSGGIYTIDEDRCVDFIDNTWNHLVLLELYNYLVSGDPVHKDIIDNIVTHIFLYMETLMGSKGNFGVKESSSANTGYCIKTGSGLTCTQVSCPGSGGTYCSNAELNAARSIGNNFSGNIEFLIGYHAATKSVTVKNLLLRMASFLKNYALYGGTGDYTPKQMSVCWVAEDPDSTIRGSVGAGVKTQSPPLANLLAYAFMLNEDTSYRDAARTVWKDAMFYVGATPSQYDSITIDSDWRFPINWETDSIHTNSRAIMVRNSSIYLYSEYGYSPGSQPPFWGISSQGASFR